MKTIKRILVPTDFSELSLAAMDFASSFSLIYDAPIYLLHVVEEASSTAGIFMADTGFNASLQKLDIQRAVADLAILNHKKLPSHLDIQPVVRVGNPAAEIVKFAKEAGIDIIVMATHGRTGLAHILLGSVAEHVLRTSGVPVLTIKPDTLRGDSLTEEEVESQLQKPE
jgi:nucleotide-binding universal stress UspA family protein